MDSEKDEARPLVGIIAVCSVRCFNTVGWLTGRLIKKPMPLYTKDYVPEQVEEEN